MFNKVNINQLDTKNICAHHGKGEILFARLADRDSVNGAINFIDVAELPPGVSIGRHTHKKTEEEYYLIIEGTGLMHRNGVDFVVKTGDLIRNPPGGTHQLQNTSQSILKIFVFEVPVA